MPRHPLSIQYLRPFLDAFLHVLNSENIFLDFILGSTYRNGVIQLKYLEVNDNIRVAYFKIF